MTDPPRFVRLLLLPVLAVLLLPALALVQDNNDADSKRKAFLEGTHVFRRILFDRKMEAIGGFDEDILRKEPEKCILVILGDLNQITEVPGGLKKFIGEGGAVLLASDRAVKNTNAREQLIETTGVSISADTLISTVAYRDESFCPWVIPEPGAEPALFKPQGDFPFRVATNVPSMLVPRREIRGLAVLARLPPGSAPEIPGRVRPKRGEPGPVFAVGGEIGNGRVLVMADHSVFINEMMLPTDNNNVEFTVDCVAWLSGEGKRDHVLFVEDGNIQTLFEIPLKDAAIPPEEALKLLFAKRNELLVEAEKGAAQLEETGFFDNKVFELLEGAGLPPIRLVSWLVILGTAVFLVYGLIRLGIWNRFRHDTSVPLLTSAVGKNLPAAPLVEQRTEALLQRNNLWEPAALMVRRWFARLGIEASAGEPVFAASGGWWQRQRILGKVRRLWRLGQGRQPEPIAAPGMWRLQRELDELRAGWESGAWGVAPSAPTPLSHKGREGSKSADSPRPVPRVLHGEHDTGDPDWVGGEGTRQQRST